MHLIIKAFSTPVSHITHIHHSRLHLVPSSYLKFENPGVMQSFPSSPNIAFLSLAIDEIKRNLCAVSCLPPLTPANIHWWNRAGIIMMNTPSEMTRVETLYKHLSGTILESRLGRCFKCTILEMGWFLDFTLLLETGSLVHWSLWLLVPLGVIHPARCDFS